MDDYLEAANMGLAVVILGLLCIAALPLFVSYLVVMLPFAVIGLFFRKTEKAS